MTQNQDLGREHGNQRGYVELHKERGRRCKGNGWGMPSGLSVESFVGLASGRLQSCCQLGSGRGEGEEFHRVHLWNLNWIPITIL